MPRTGDILGYARVSTADQDLSGQKDRLLQHGAIRVFEDVISGKTFNRPGLAAFNPIKPGPTTLSPSSDSIAWDARSGTSGNRRRPQG